MTNFFLSGSIEYFILALALVGRKEQRPPEGGTKGADHVCSEAGVASLTDT